MLSGENKAEKGFVYFIASHELKMVKIGYTKNVCSRFRYIEAASPVKLFVPLVLSGDKNFERMLHKEFKQYRSHREWYFMRDDVARFIKDKTTEKKELIKQGGKPCDCNFCYLCDLYSWSANGIPIMKHRRNKDTFGAKKARTILA